MARRAIILVLDGVGIGEAPDAAAYGDTGSHTLGNVARAVELSGAAQVDVSSGVESAPGVKDADRIAAFTAAANSPVSSSKQSA